MEMGDCPLSRGTTVFLVHAVLNGTFLLDVPLDGHMWRAVNKSKQTNKQTIFPLAVQGLMKSV